MPPKKNSTPSPAGRSTKKQRMAIDLDMKMKMKIIRDYKDGKKVKVIADDRKLAHSTISTILKDKVWVKEAVKALTSFKAIITRQWKGLIHEMEKMLAIWFDEQIHKKIPMSLLTIQAKACSIFATLKEQQEEESTETFTASHGRFPRFRSRFNRHNCDISGEVATAWLPPWWLRWRPDPQFEGFDDYNVFVFHMFCILVLVPPQDGGRDTMN